MELNIFNLKKEKKEHEKKVLLPQIFENKFNQPLVHQVVISYLSNARIAVKTEKNRSQVSGGGIKPFRQKGTGKARAGSIRSPLWKGGGKTFVASEQRNYKKKINKKMYRKALKCILSELVNQKRLILVDDFAVDEIKTKNIMLKLKMLNIFSGLLIMCQKERNLDLSSKNIPNFFIKNVKNINPLILIKNKNIIITSDALKRLEELLK